VVFGGHFENTMTNASGQSLGENVTVIQALGRSVVSVHDLTVTGHGNYRLAETSNGAAGYEGSIRFNGVTRLRHPTSPFSIPVTQFSGKLDMVIGGVREVYDFDRLRSWKRRFVLRDNQAVYAFGPPGIMVRGNVYASNALTVGAGQQLNGLWIGRSGDNGFNLAAGVNGQIVPGQDQSVSVYGGTVGGVHWAQRNSAIQLLCTTSSGAGLNAAAQFVDFEAWFAPLVEAGYAQSESEWRKAGTERDFREAHFPAFDIPLVAANSSVTVDFAIPAMAAGDFLDAVRVNGGLGALVMTSAEARNGFARLILSNPGQTAFDLAPADIAISYSSPQGGA